MQEKDLSISSVTLKNGAQIFGYTGEYVFGRISSAKDYYERSILDNWLCKPDSLSVIYDIGANLGNHSVYFGRETAAKNVYSFEPVPENFALLEKNIQENGLSDMVHPFPYAAGQEEGTFSMTKQQAGNNGTFSIQDTADESDGSIQVRVVSIDEMNLPLPDFIKIDVEGFELSVLLGMQKTLEACSAYLWIEVDEENAAAVCALLRKFGYVACEGMLQAANNLLFTKKQNENTAYEYFFNSALQEAAEKRNNFILLGNTRSQFQYEQQMAQKQKEQLKEKDTQIKEKDTQLKEKDAKILELDSLLTKMREEKQRTVPIRMARYAYKVVQPYPKIMRMLEQVNNRLHLFADTTVLQPSSVKRALSTQNNEFKTPSALNVAMLVDTFTYNSFRFECNAFPLEPATWQEVFLKNDIDLFFCESAWAGVDAEKALWKGQVYASVNFNRENRKILLSILEHCKKNNIPTVFWNKEDPTHYEDRVHDFVKTAVLFDHIFTTDADCVNRYKNDYGHKSVHALPFATQPRLFNPIEAMERTNEVIFAGSWYRQHEKRSEEMEKILDGILESGHPLKIYDRHFHDTDPNHIFPDRFLPYVHPPLAHDQMDAAYKGSRYALNINTVTNSKTMFARRVFELMSSNTLVLSNPSLGMQEMFGDYVQFFDGNEPLNIENALEKRAFCLEHVLKYHTYRQRFHTVLKQIQFPFQEDEPTVSLVYEVDSVHKANDCVQHFQSLLLQNGFCILLMPLSCSAETVQEIVCRYQSATVTAVSRAYFGKTTSLWNTSHYILASTSLSSQFIQRALLHSQYLAPDMPVAEGAPAYTFAQAPLQNTLFPAQKKGMVLEDKNTTLRAYLIDLGS